MAHLLHPHVHHILWYASAAHDVRSPRAGSIFVTSILAYTWYQHDARLDNEEVKEALELRAMLLGSATIPTPGEAEKMRKLTGKLTMRTDPGIAQPAPRTTLSPASLTVRAPLLSFLLAAPWRFPLTRVAGPARHREPAEARRRVLQVEPRSRGHPLLARGRHPR